MFFLFKPFTLLPLVVQVWAFYRRSMTTWQNRKFTHFCASRLWCFKNYYEWVGDHKLWEYRVASYLLFSSDTHHSVTVLIISKDHHELRLKLGSIIVPTPFQIWWKLSHEAPRSLWMDFKQFTKLESDANWLRWMICDNLWPCSKTQPLWQCLALF
jgi:hypothetical protein